MEDNLTSTDPVWDLGIYRRKIATRCLTLGLGNLYTMNLTLRLMTKLWTRRIYQGYLFYRHGQLYINAILTVWFLRNRYQNDTIAKEKENHLKIICESCCVDFVAQRCDAWVLNHVEEWSDRCFVLAGFGEHCHAWHNRCVGIRVKVIVFFSW